MAKKQIMQELQNKKHIFRTIFICSAVAVCIAAVTLGFTISPNFSPAMAIVDGAFGLLGTGLLIGSGVGVQVTNNKIKIVKSQKASQRALEKISELSRDADLSASMSTRSKAKIIKKYANANLQLCKRLGSPAVGIMPSGMYTTNQQKVYLMNKIEAYELLEGVQTSTGKKAKYSKKIALAKKELIRCSEHSVKSPANKWTQTYSGIIDSVSIYDRRTEITCMNPETQEKFEKLANSTTTTSAVGASVHITFGRDSHIIPTYARIADSTKISRVKTLLLQDIVLEATSKDSEISECVETIFPIQIEVRRLNAYGRFEPQVTTIDNFAELKANAGIVADSSSNVEA